MTFFDSLNETHEAEIIKLTENSYKKIEEYQKDWYEKSKFFCPAGCGECCRNFEPDLMESEALFMAYWLIENQKETSLEVCKGNFPFSENSGCPFWDEHKNYHCTIYGGRPYICRLFGACSNKSKTGKTVFKPCKFYPLEKLQKYNSVLQHKQYSEEETQKIFKAVPPVMSDFLEDAVSISADSGETKLIREILPQTIKQLLWISSLNS